LDKALAAMEGTETAEYPHQEWEQSHYAIAIVQLQEITLFLAGLYMEALCFLEKLYAAFGGKTSFCRHHKLDIVEAAITADTKVLY
jgi:methionine-gamma-lyase